MAPSTTPQDIHYAEGEETDTPNVTPHPPYAYDKAHWNEEMHWMEALYEADFPKEEYYDY